MRENWRVRALIAASITAATAIAFLLTAPDASACGGFFSRKTLETSGGRR
jgi:hypothetical protein